MNSSYLDILRQIEQEIRATVQQLEARQEMLEARFRTPEVRNLYLAIWEDRFSLISESDLPEGLSWSKYEQIVLARCQGEIHSSDAEQAKRLETELAEIESQLKAWRFAHSMVESYTRQDAE